MDTISIVKQVIGIATKKDGSELKGVSSNGKPWTMYEVILENGIKLKVFGPVNVGDTVYELVQDPQYKSWNGKVKKAGSGNVVDMSQPTNAQIMNEILEIKKLLTKSEPMTQDTFNKDVVLEDINDGEEISLIDVPF